MTGEFGTCGDDTERHQCRAHWPDDHISTQDGRRCRFILEQRDDGNWYCPAHGQQSVPELSTDETDTSDDTEQTTLMADGGTPRGGTERLEELSAAVREATAVSREQLTELEEIEHGKTYECPHCGEPVTEH
jgi:hypothetical protein